MTPGSGRLRSRRTGSLPGRLLLVVLLAVAAALLTSFSATASASATTVETPAQSMLPTLTEPTPAVTPTPPAVPGAEAEDGTTSVDFNVGGDPSSSVVVLLGLTVLSVAPALLLLTTSFTKIVIVLSLTRNALGLTNTPPAQVITGLAVFLSIFVMSPVLEEVNALGLQPYLNEGVPISDALEAGSVPLREFMLDQTRDAELALFLDVAQDEVPEDRSGVDFTTLVPAFLISEIKSAFIIGFVVFIPFLVIDLVISSVLMAMGMMMLPPVLVSLPFKLLLFVLVDGWSLIVRALVSSYGGAGP